MFCENGLWGERDEAGKEKQTEKTVAELPVWQEETRRGFHGSLKKTASLHGQRGDESGPRLLRKTANSRKATSRSANRSGKMELTGDLTGRQFGGVVGGEYGG